MLHNIYLFLAAFSCISCFHLKINFYIIILIDRGNHSEDDDSSLPTDIPARLPTDDTTSLLGDDGATTIPAGEKIVFASCPLFSHSSLLYFILQFTKIKLLDSD